MTSEAEKFSLIEALSSDAELTAEGRVFTVDGLRIEFSDGWGLVRASNTTPRLTLRFAGESEEIGRCRVFPRGWLENESIWTHMEYKFFLELIGKGSELTTI